MSAASIAMSSARSRLWRSNRSHAAAKLAAPRAIAEPIGGTAAHPGGARGSSDDAGGMERDEETLLFVGGPAIAALAGEWHRDEGDAYGLEATRAGLGGGGGVVHLPVWSR